MLTPATPHRRVPKFVQRVLDRRVAIVDELRFVRARVGPGREVAGVVVVVDGEPVELEDLVGDRTGIGYQVAEACLGPPRVREFERRGAAGSIPGEVPWPAGNW